MNRKLIQHVLDACFLAKKITEIMPELPQNLKPRHIHIITRIAERGEKGEIVRVSDVSGDLKITMPSVTKLINELAVLKILEKYTIITDKRATALKLTKLGEEYYNTYVLCYHERLMEQLSDLEEEACKTMISTIETLYDGISKVAEEDFNGKED